MQKDLVKVMDNSFSSAASVLPPRLQRYLLSVPDKLTREASEIRLRTDSLIALTVRGKTVLLTDGDAPRTDRETMEEIFLRLCRNSVYSHRDEIASGYVTAPGGHRVGICGRAVTQNGIITSVADISSLNIRISRRHAETAEELMRLLIGRNAVSSFLLYGPPLSGKTTVLRELAYGLAKKGVRVAVVDERRELAEHSSVCMDVFSGYPRKQGIEQALRLFSPEVIVFDELGNRDDTDSLLAAVNAGAAVITTAHAPDIDSLKGRKFMHDAVCGGIFNYFIQLTSGERPGRIAAIYDGDGVRIEDCCNDNCYGGDAFSGADKSVMV